MNPVRAEMVKYPGEIDKTRKATNGNFALGSERFLAEVGNVLAHRVTPGKLAVREKCARTKNVDVPIIPDYNKRKKTSRLVKKERI
jgi:hypothetical protein